MGNQMQREMTARVPLLGKKGELLDICSMIMTGRWWQVCRSV